MKSGIYMIKCRETGKVYIGHSLNMKSRYQTHLAHLKSGRHGNPHLLNSFKKYGKESLEFLIVEKCNSENLLEREYFWIDYFKSTNPKFGFNIMFNKKNEKQRFEICNSEIYRENMRFLVKKRWENPEYAKKNIEAIQNSHKERNQRGEVLSILTPESKKKSRASCSTPKFLKELSERSKRQLEDPEQRKIALKTLEEGRNNPLRIENLRKAKQCPEYKKMIAEKTRLSWIKRREKNVK